MSEIEDFSEKRRIEAEVKKMTTIDENDLEAKLFQAAAKASAKNLDAAQKNSSSDVDMAKVRNIIKSNVSYKENEEAENDYIERHSTREYPDICNILDKFSFSKDQDKYAKQMGVITSSVLCALNDLVLEDVAANTKNAFKNYVKKIVKVPGGIKVFYDFDGNKQAVIAKGAFQGDETICIYSADNFIKTSVLKLGKNNIDVTQSFDMSIHEWSMLNGQFCVKKDK